MKYLSKALLILLSCTILSACSGSNIITRSIDADFVAQSHGFSRKIIKGGEFWLTTYQRVTTNKAPYVFYIEGDGLAFRGRYTISDNPTPVHPMLLKLAGLDERPNVVYIARPCQYTPMNLNPTCNKQYWTHKRMSTEVVDSINAVINNINNNQPFSLIGYSGGGGVAVLIAAKNKLTKDIITIAANLDHVAFNKHHNTQPMIGSLNPIDYAKSINYIPQLHLSGARDDVVPAFITDKFVQASNSDCVHQEIFYVAQHSKGWEAIWPYILSLPLTCHK